MRLRLAKWHGILQHLWWRLRLWSPLPRANTEPRPKPRPEPAAHDEQLLSGWKLALVGMVVVLVSVGSFFI